MAKIRYILILLLFTTALTTINMNEKDKNQINTTEQNPQIQDIQVFMCKETDCEQIYIENINKSNNSIYCAFFDYDLELLNNIIKKKKTNKLILVDKDNEHFNDTFIIYDKRSAYMHNKFCILDEKTTITGSFNPTINGRDKNDNNIIIIESKKIAKIYLNYFRNHLNNNFTIKRNHNIANISICFSRGGNCLNKINNILKNANQSIYFMLFTMTDKRITNTLLIKHYTNTTIKGIFEKSLITRYSSYHKLQHHNLSIKKDSNSGKLHHKVFIIDNKTVITGSMNPSHNADHNNEENLLIIKNKDIAKEYLKEYKRLFH